MFSLIDALVEYSLNVVSCIIFVSIAVDAIVESRCVVASACADSVAEVLGFPAG